MANDINELTLVTALDHLTHTLIVQSETADDPYEKATPDILSGMQFDASAGTPTGTLAGSFTPASGTGSVLKWKIVSLATRPNNGTANNAHGLTGDFRVLHMWAFLKNTSTNKQICIPHYDSQTASNSIGIELDATNVVLNSSGDYTSSNWTGFAIIIYYDYTAP